MADYSLPATRKLRIFAFDPGFGRRLESVGINEVTVSIPWEMDPVSVEEPFLGGAGEYLEVVDYDPSSELYYDPIDLNDPVILANSGMFAADDDPKFHQQMVYAVAMVTIANFEKALGRVALWSSRMIRDENGQVLQDLFVRRLRIYPHALREANAYYSPAKKALLFGYFEADDRVSSIVPGSTVFTCLSHDVIAHETTHALLDGMHPRWTEGSNADIRALHEAFADIVAIFQHFSFSEVLIDQVARTRGDLASENLLGQLAQEFGSALGRGKALRDALGEVGDDGVWRRHLPDRKALQKRKGAHARGAILVSAVFDAFLNIYRVRTADLLRIATGGSGMLPAGAIHPDLVKRLSEAAAKYASHVLQMCVRALDYCPPVDVTFGDYLRAILTADYDLEQEDEHNYRVAFLEAFLAWGIYPEGFPVYSPKALLWPTLREVWEDRGKSESMAAMEKSFGRLVSDPNVIAEWMKEDSRFVGTNEDLSTMERELVKALKDVEEERIMHRPQTKGASARKDSFSKDGFLNAKFTERKTGHSKNTHENLLGRNLLDLGLSANRRVEWLARKYYAMLFWGMLHECDEALLNALGLTLAQDSAPTVYRSELTDRPSLEVHSVRMAARRGARGQEEREYVVEVTQRRRGYLDEVRQRDLDARKPTKGRTDVDRTFPKEDFKFRRGCTLLIEARNFTIRRVIRNQGTVNDDLELAKLRNFLMGNRQVPLNAFDEGEIAFEAGDESFAALHRNVEAI